jgi:hypothetical protein
MNQQNIMLVEHLQRFLNGKYDSLDVRLHNFNIKMTAIPAYYEAAKKNLKINT